MATFHSEPYIYLAGLRHDAALIAWGAFYFRTSSGGADDEMKLVEDKDLKHVFPPRKTSIGRSSQSYGNAVVSVTAADGSFAVDVAVSKEENRNHAWVHGLRPDTKYTYEVRVNGEVWAGGPRRDWVIEKGLRGFRRTAAQYENRFRTFPDPTQASPDFTFAIVGDYGRGVDREDDDPGGSNRQAHLATALTTLVDAENIRFLLTTGDNIYGRGLFRKDSGRDDDDWFFPFFQPYRYIINRIPTYPTCGNHDDDETEAAEDFLAMLDNFYIDERLGVDIKDKGDASEAKGLFYRFRFGSNVEFVALDTSADGLVRQFDKSGNRTFLAKTFPPSTAAGDMWRIPFFHHPPFCQGPAHGDDRAVEKTLVDDFFSTAGVRVVFAGHEHLFEIVDHGGIRYYVTGGGGEVRTGPLKKTTKATVVAVAQVPHVLVVKISGKTMTVTPFGERDGAPVVLPKALDLNRKDVPAVTTVSLA
jgi:hypothetical protein